MSVDDEIAHVDGLLHGGRQQTHVCGDGTVVVFPGAGTSHVDVEATERNQEASAVKAHVHAQGQAISALEKAVQHLRDASKRGPA